MRFIIATGIVSAALGLAPVRAAEGGCGEIVRLAVEPAAKAQDVAGALRRRLTAAGVKDPVVAIDGDALRAILPPGMPDTLLTRPARIEFRLIAKSADEPGAVSLPRVDGGTAESVEPEVILDESRMRDVKAVQEPNPAGGAPVGAISFRFEPTAAKNLMAASVEAVGRKLAIIVDDKIVADPLIRAPIGSMNGQISGAFTPQSAQEMVDLLRSGRLVAGVSVLDRKPAPEPCSKP